MSDILFNFTEIYIFFFSHYKPIIITKWHKEEGKI